MLVCPDCATPLAGELPDLDPCPNCSWTVRVSAGIPDMLSSRDRESPIFEDYRRNYDEIAEDDLGESIQEVGELEFQAQRLFAHLGDVRGLSVCDVGIGQGLLLDLIREAGGRTTGVDVAAPYLAKYGGKDETRLVVANAENLPFAEEFDLVIAADVLEHVINPGEVLLSIHRALLPRGRLVLRVPYKDDLTGYTRAKGMKYAMVHLRDFNRENLKRLLRNGGFELEGLRFDAFYAAKKRGYLASVGPISRGFDRLMERRVGGAWNDARVWPPLGRALMRPNVVTALARKPASE